MNKKPVDAEKEWYQPSAPKAYTEKHHFPHRLIHTRLGEYVREIGCTANTTILDIGCGGGNETEFISPVTRHITGVDISAQALVSFRAKGFEGIAADVRALPFPDESFDCVLCPEILHHLRGQGDLSDYIVEFSRVLKKNGFMITIEPNAFSVSGMLMNVANTVKPGITGLVPHERALSPFGLKKAFKKAGLTDIRCIAASYVWNRYPLSVSQFFARHEDAIRYKAPFNYFGWFSIVSGKKSA